jgi:hypothetical protein
MKNEICQKIRPLLVDYSDGVLPADDVRQIAGHLAHCPDCRAELCLLEDSLSLAREVWNESGDCPDFRVNENGTVPLNRSTNKPLAVSCGNGQKPLAVSRKKYRRALALIGGAAAVCAIVVILLFSRPTGPKDEFDAMQYIAREERSARLAASVQILADQPSLKQYKEDAERYLKENYADTAAVRMLEKQQTQPE